MIIKGTIKEVQEQLNLLRKLFPNMTLWEMQRYVRYARLDYIVGKQLQDIERNIKEWIMKVLKAIWKGIKFIGGSILYIIGVLFSFNFIMDMFNGGKDKWKTVLFENWWNGLQTLLHTWQRNIWRNWRTRTGRMRNGL